MLVTSLKSRFILILLLHSNVVKSYKEIEVRELIYFNNLFLHLYNK